MARRLAIIAPVFPPYHGGMGAVACRHAELFTARGYEVHVYTPWYAEKQEELVGTSPAHAAAPIENRDGYFIHWLLPSFAHGNAGHIDLSGAFVDNDIVHLHFPFYFSAEQCIRLRKKYPEKKFFITYHMDPVAGGLKGLFFWLYAAYMTPKILRVADKIFVSTREYPEAMSNGNYFRTHREQVIEAPFGVDSERFTVDRVGMSAFRSQHNLQPDIPVILFVGGMDAPHYFKGIPVLLRAFDRLAQPAQLVLVGDGGLRPRYEKQAAHSKKYPQIHFVGAVPTEELAHWYQAADVFVLPSLNRSEAFGLVLLEAMASGVACIASDIPGVSTVLDHGKNELLFPVGDDLRLAEAISTFLHDSTQRAHAGVVGRARVEQQYAWPRMADTYEAWYTNFE